MQVVSHERLRTCVNGISLEVLLAQEVQHPNSVRCIKCIVRSCAEAPRRCGHRPPSAPGRARSRRLRRRAAASHGTLAGRPPPRPRMSPYWLRPAERCQRPVRWRRSAGCLLHLCAPLPTGGIAAMYAATRLRTPLLCRLRTRPRWVGLGREAAPLQRATCWRELGRGRRRYSRACV